MIKKVHQIEQGFQIVVTGMRQASDIFEDLGEDKKAAIKAVPEVVWRTMHKDLVKTEWYPLKPVAKALGALDHVLRPEALAGVYGHGQAEKDSPLTVYDDP